MKKKVLFTSWVWPLKFVQDQLALVWFLSRLILDIVKMWDTCGGKNHHILQQEARETGHTGSPLKAGFQWPKDFPWGSISSLQPPTATLPAHELLGKTQLEMYPNPIMLWWDLKMQGRSLLVGCKAERWLTFARGWDGGHWFEALKNLAGFCWFNVRNSHALKPVGRSQGFWMAPYDSQQKWRT